MTDIFTHPDFAGLHWSIPRDTPPEERERAHLYAAIAAKLARDRRLNQPTKLAYDPVVLQFQLDTSCARVDSVRDSRIWMEEKR